VRKKNLFIELADHPKRPAKHYWLGQPLPDQLPNTMQAHQTTLLSFLWNP
jgi:hypothetical protein